MGIHSAYAGMGQNERLVRTVNVHHIPEGLGMDMGKIDKDVQFIELRDELVSSMGESMFSAKWIVWERCSTVDRVRHVDQSDSGQELILTGCGAIGRPLERVASLDG